MNEDTIIITNEDGTEVECDVYMTCQDSETGKQYIIYTDNTVDSEGNTSVYASILSFEEARPALLPIETEEEWEQIRAIIKEHQEQ